MEQTSFSLQPIGVIHTPYEPDGVCPHQPPDHPRGESWLEIAPRWQPALERLEEFSHLYLLFLLDRPEHEPQPLVTPPWAGKTQVGLFASRSPHRPCPLGLSVVRLRRIEGNRLYTSLVDAYDGTPLLDIKPYLRSLDAKLDANDGWMEHHPERQHLLDHLLGKPHHHGHDHGGHHHHG